VKRPEDAVRCIRSRLERPRHGRPRRPVRSRRDLRSTLKNELIDVAHIAGGAVVIHFWSRLTAGAAHPIGPHEVDTLVLAVLTRHNETWRIRALENVTLTNPRTGEPILRVQQRSGLDEASTS